MDDWERVRLLEAEGIPVYRTPEERERNVLAESQTGRKEYERLLFNRVENPIDDLEEQIAWMLNRRSGIRARLVKDILVDLMRHRLLRERVKSLIKLVEEETNATRA